tara:strand:- start:1439 stop:1672 length:234 start_codon:yes stop_codon:yes gene_type:complete
MTDQNIIKLIQIISKVININSKLIDKDSCASEFAKWDSLAHLKLMLEIEKKFKVKISTSKMSDLNSVSKILKFIESK